MTMVESAGPARPSPRASRERGSPTPSGSTPKAPPLPSRPAGLVARAVGGVSSTSITPGELSMSTPSRRLRTVSTGARNGSLSSGSRVERSDRNCGDAPPQPAAWRVLAAAALARRSTSFCSACDTRSAA
jgi:hypothetical protein